jgi:P4 family phage/plasmid primase-like protien
MIADQPLKLVKGGGAPVIEIDTEPPLPPDPIEEEKTDPYELLHKPDDDILAINIAEALANKVHYFHGEWKVLANGCWTHRDGSEVRKYVRNHLRDWRARGVNVTQQRIKSVTAMLEDDLHIADRSILEMANERRKYINLRNGLFNLETMSLEKHNPELYFTTQLDFDYDPDAMPTVWLKYLNSSLVHPDGSTDHNLVTFVQEALGYSLTARTDLKASFWLVGERDSGKSTMIAFLKLLMGDLHGTIDLNQLSTNRFLLGGMIGKRVVTFTEAEASTILPDALYKALVGGTDEIYADVKNREPIVFVPEAKIWWAMNSMPRVTDRSGATTRRIFIIPFNRSIPVGSRIQNLEKKLYDERAGIFNWLIQHYWRVLRNPGFSPCAQSEERRREYIADNDTEATFVGDRCELHESYSTPSAVLYLDYKMWCESFGFKPKNINQIAGEWRRLGFERQKTGELHVWHGLRIKK